MKPYNSLQWWAVYIHECACSKGWWTNPEEKVDVAVTSRFGPDKTWRNRGELIALVHSELSEALEEYRNGKIETYLVAEELPSGEIVNKPCGFNNEIADVFIRLLDICGAYGIDIEGEMALKMEYNKKRAHRHGGKAC